MDRYLKICMVNPQKQILSEIGCKAFTRNSVASTYAWCIRQREECDFPLINRAILKRWSPYALDYIKKLAWKQFDIARERQQLWEKRKWTTNYCGTWPTRHLMS